MGQGECSEIRSPWWWHTAVNIQQITKLHIKWANILVYKLCLNQARKIGRVESWGLQLSSGHGARRTHSGAGGQDAPVCTSVSVLHSSHLPGDTSAVTHAILCSNLSSCPEALVATSREGPRPRFLRPPTHPSPGGALFPGDHDITPGENHGGSAPVLNRPQHPTRVKTGSG